MVEFRLLEYFLELFSKIVRFSCHSAFDLCFFLISKMRNVRLAFHGEVL